MPDAKRVAVFPESLNVVREKLEPYSLTELINIPHAKDQDVYV